MLRFSRYSHQIHLLKVGFSSSSSFGLVRMASKSFLKPTLLHYPSFPSIRRPYKTCKFLLPVVCSESVSKTLPYSPLKTNGFTSLATVGAPVHIKDSPMLKVKLLSLKPKLQEVGIELDEMYPGQHNHLLCPMCNGGELEEKTFSVVIDADGSGAAWTCFRAKCGWTGRTKLMAGKNSTYKSSIKANNMKSQIRKITMESLELEPLCNELVGYLNERLITEETLQRNHVMQRSNANQVMPGELTVVTGVPISGKSEWIDALVCNLNRNVGWKFALCSMENKRFLASSSYRFILPPPIRRLGHLRTRFLAHCTTSQLSILQSEDKVKVLKQKMELLEINCDDSCVPGYFSHLFCPKEFRNVEVLSYFLRMGWADGRATDQGINKIFKVTSSSEVTAESITLEPLGEKLIAYFADRMISEETLNRNGVMQIAGDKVLEAHQDVIAFTYIHNGMHVGCKYRTIEKRFFQEKGTWKWLYGLDDLNKASEIIIVEGEIDKLSVEEAGFSNCVSVPGGAPQGVSAKELPAVENDKAYQYLWNCKEYLDKMSRIVLATDGDLPGQALAEELARRLGKERCWIVRWPKKDESSSFKDANEVLRCLGPSALKQVIESAELYNPHSIYTYDIR